MSLTWRMKDWIVKLGAHIAFSDENAFPVVIVSDAIKVEEDNVIIAISDAQKKQLDNIQNISEWAAIAPGNLGSIRAPYQFKGIWEFNGNNIIVHVSEIYCTKPGAEAGLRLDVLKEEEIKTFDESRWSDGAPTNN